MSSLRRRTWIRVGKFLAAITFTAVILASIAFVIWVVMES